MNVPKLRFKEFDGEWEENKLSNLLVKIEEKATDATKGVVLTSSRTGLFPRSEYFNGREEKDIEGYSIIPKNTFTYRQMSDDNTFHINYNTKYNLGLVSPEYPVFKTNNFLTDEYFLNYINNSPRFKKHCVLQKKGGTRTRLYFKVLGELVIAKPSIEEQKKIGDFFNLLNKKIQLQQQKIDLLQEQKKGYMQKVFKQKINFGSDDIWQTKKVSEVATLLNGRAYKKEELLAEGKYRVLRVGNFFTNDSWYYSNLELENDKYANKGDLLYAWSASFGPQIWDDEKIIYHYHIWKVVPNEKMIERDFLYHWFDFDKERILSQKNGTTMVHITKGGLEKTDIQLPSLEQQQRISNFFNKLDERINLNKVYLKALQKQKQGFMQQMFI